MSKIFSPDFRFDSTASIPTTSYCVATETEEVKKALADIPLGMSEVKSLSLLTLVI